MAHTANRPLDEGGPAGVPAGESGLIQTAQALWGDLRDVAHARLQIAALEARQAGQGLASMLACGIVIGALLAGAWFGMAGALVLWLVERGLAVSGALAVAALINLLGAAGLALVMRRQSRSLGFPATLRGLEPCRDGSGLDGAAR